jgi:riboflavin kinase/FMN adenylyltransferase
MLVHFGLHGLNPEWKSCTVTIGAFDGIHLGHQALISEAVADGQRHEIPAVAVTFDRHPLAVICPEREPEPVLSLDQNLAQMRRLGLAAAVVIPFDAHMAVMEADSFVKRVLLDAIHAGRAVVGHDFGFGRDREGTAEMLRQTMPVTELDQVLSDGIRVSSTEVRRAINAGHVENATRMLGRPFSIQGTVVSGKKLGRELGFPTINLARHRSSLTPADGVYAGWAKTPLGNARAAISIGHRPAVGGGERSIEAYLLDWDESLYGMPLELGFEARLRNELDFPDLDALKTQIGKDVEETRTKASLPNEPD